MKIRTLAFVAAATVSLSSAARADDPHAKTRTTGNELPSVGGSLVVTAPIVFVAGMAYVQSNPYSYAAFGPIGLGAIGGAFIGLGLLVPGIVMLATCHAPKDRVLPTPETKMPAWTETRPIAAGGPSAFTMSILRGSF